METVFDFIRVILSEVQNDRHSKIIQLLLPELLALIDGKNSPDLLQKGLDNKRIKSIHVVEKGVEMVETDVLRLNDMSVGELKEMWRQYFDSEPIWKTKRFYIPRLAYRMQELAYGGVPEHIKNLLLGKTVLKHAEDNDGTRLPPVGTRLVKTYRGKEYNVIVSTAGFQFEGIYYKSLSAVALKITGKRISGRFFFGLGENK